jgi:hypothetical protein
MSDFEKIRELNDALRKSLTSPRRMAKFGQSARLVVTSGIQALGLDGMLEVVQAVSNYDDFSTNDPYREHDFGFIDRPTGRVYWKIDYYNRTLSSGSDNPADPAITTRVLTIMLASEY